MQPVIVIIRRSLNTNFGYVSIVRCNNDNFCISLDACEVEKRFLVHKKFNLNGIAH